MSSNHLRMVYRRKRHNGHNRLKGGSSPNGRRVPPFLLRQHVQQNVPAVPRRAPILLILLIGFVMAALRNPPYKKPMIDPKMGKEEILDALENARHKEPMIDPKMSDEEIAEKLQDGRGDLLSNLVILLGGLLIVIGLGWRMLRALLAFF